MSKYIRKAEKGLFKTLVDIWQTKLLRRIISALVRSPLRSSILQIVELNISMPKDSGCVFVASHSPWKRILVQWCLRRKNTLFIATGEWKSRKNKIRRKGKGIKDLNQIVTFLKQNGTIIIPADVFNDRNNCPVDFLGEQRNASLFPIRLAKLANVPLIVGIPFLEKGKIKFIEGPRLEVDEFEQPPCAVTQNILGFLESQIKNNPSIWRTFHK